MSDSLADLASVAGEIAAQMSGTVTLRISSELAEEVWAQAATEVAAAAAYEAEAAAAAAAAAEVAATDTPGNAEASVGKGGEKRVSISADVMSGCEVAGASGVTVAADAGHLSEAAATEAEASALSGLSLVFRFSDESETGIDIADVMGGKVGDHGARGDVEASSAADVAEVPQVEALVGAVQAVTSDADEAGAARKRQLEVVAGGASARVHGTDEGGAFGATSGAAEEAVLQGVEDWTDALVASEGEPDWEDVQEDLELLLAGRQEEERGLWREQEFCGDGLNLDAEDLLERVDHLIEEELTRCTTRELLGASEHEAHLNRLPVHDA